MTLVRLKDPDREVKVAVEALADRTTRKKVLKNILFKSDLSGTVVVPIKGTGRRPGLDSWRTTGS